MVTAILAGLVVACLLVGLLPSSISLILSVGAAGLFLAAGSHVHDSALAMDVYARRSRFAEWNAAVKVTGCLGLLVISVLQPAAPAPLVLAVVMAMLTMAGGQRLHNYLALLSLPMIFLLLSGLAILWDFAPAAGGVWCFPLPGAQWLVLTVEAQETARLVLSRAVGAVSCLYFLSLSTTMPEILGVLRRAHIPSLVIELALLIYRYIFVLLATWREMQNAAASRLGYDGLRQSIHTTGAVYGNLLSRSFRRASASFDAMESRCYTGEIRFLEPEKPVTADSLILFGLLWIAAVCGGFCI